MCIYISHLAVLLYYTHTNTHTHTHIHANIHAHTHAHTHIHTHKYTHTHAHTYTHTHASSSNSACIRYLPYIVPNLRTHNKTLLTLYIALISETQNSYLNITRTEYVTK